VNSHALSHDVSKCFCTNFDFVYFINKQQYVNVNVKARISFIAEGPRDALSVENFLTAAKLRKIRFEMGCNR